MCRDNCLLKLAAASILMAVPMGCSRGNDKSATAFPESPGNPHPAAATEPGKMNAGEERLPGSEKSLEDALQAANLIVIATVLAVPAPSGGDAPGENYYAPVEMEVKRVLRGDAVGKIMIGVSVRVYPPDKAQAIPRVGQRLLFLLRKINNPHEAIKNT